MLFVLSSVPSSSDQDLGWSDPAFEEEQIDEGVWLEEEEEEEKRSECFELFQILSSLAQALDPDYGSRLLQEKSLPFRVVFLFRGVVSSLRLWTRF